MWRIEENREEIEESEANAEKEMLAVHVVCLSFRTTLDLLRFYFGIVESLMDPICIQNIVTILKQDWTEFFH